jgi:hypothetical protein
LNSQSGNDREPRQKPPKILFLGGLSGAGKTTFSRDYLEAVHGWSWIEIDVRNANGIDVNDLRSVWNEFYLRHKPGPLRDELSRRAAGRSHVVLTFSSCQVFTERQLGSGEGFFHFAYLYDGPGRCLQAFLDRERKLGSAHGADGAGTDHWYHNNVSALYQLHEPHNCDLLIQAFNPNGTRRDPESIYREVLNLIGEPENVGGQPKT